MPEVIVIGSTPARVTTSHRVTPSATPRCRGLVVRNAYRRAASRSASVTVVLTAAKRTHVGALAGPGSIAEIGAYHEVRSAYRA